MIVRESTPEETENAIRDGMFALISPVMTLTDATLCGNDQMDTCRTRQLCQTADGILDFPRGNHHEVSQLVDDHHDLRKFFRLIRIVDVSEGFDLLVVAP